MIPIQKLKSFTTQSIRVWRILKKPSSYEYKTVAKVSTLGILVLGLVGFIISVAMKSFS
jgi:protein transport protein SEC61 subunit gamma and related proteins